MSQMLKVNEIHDDYKITGHLGEHHGQLLISNAVLEDYLCYGGLDYNAVTKDTLHITRVNIKKGHRFKGLGKKMLSILQNYAKTNNKMLTVAPGGYDTDTPLELQTKFYESYGFIEDTEKEGLYVWVAY